VSPVPLSEAKPTDKGFQFLDRLYFKTAVTYFQIKRVFGNKNDIQQELPIGTKSDFPFLIAESKSVIFSDRVQERFFEKGKLENLKIAAKAILGRVVGPSSEFSFWKQIGKPTESKGFQVGREIRWGCMVPGVGGGLCQLSGALYECANQMGAKITEIHSHTHRLPNTPYRPEKDATVFWNYVDFRFQTKSDILIEPSFTDDEFILRFWGKLPQERITAQPFGFQKALVQDCLDCGIENCAYHEKTQILISDKDLIFSPALGSLSAIQKFKTNFLSRMARSLTRGLNWIGLPVGKAAILRGQVLAFWVKTLYPFQRSPVFLSQDLAPYLKDWLQSKGLPYVLKLEHLPMTVLQKQLDQLVQSHPADTRLQDFRAPQTLLKKETQSIQEAQSLVTDHPYLKELFPAAELKPSVQAHKITVNQKGNKNILFFPGPCYVREGLNELLTVAERLELKVICPHPTAKSQTQIQYVEESQIPWQLVLAYVHPCVFDRPNALLNQTVANNVSIVGTSGVPYRGPLMTRCELGSAEDLEDKLQNLMDLYKGEVNV
jgi:hypothetical protein